MSSPMRSAAIAVTTMVLALLLTGCPPLPREVGPPPVEEVTVRITECQTESIGILVRPWEAWVRRGRPLEWAATGVDSLAIVPIDQWPFPEPPTMARPDPQRPAEPARARAGTVLETVQPGQRYRYRILAYCGERVIDIDPDIIISM